MSGMVASDAPDLVRRAGDLERLGQYAEALTTLHVAAHAGDPVAMTMLGARLVTGRGAPMQPEAGARWLVLAGERGGPASRRLASAILAAGVGMPSNSELALDGLLIAAQGGDVSARGQIAVLTSDPDLADRLTSGQAVSGIGFASARRAIDLLAWRRPPQAEIVRASPYVRIVREFLSRQACEWIRQSASGRLEGVAVKGADGLGDRATALRTATGAGFDLLRSDVVMVLVRARIAAAIDIPVARFEPTNVLHYEPGQHYGRHFDFFDTAVPDLARVVEIGGQRSATALVYLNDDYEGGETDFPELGFRFKASAGDALLFSNVDETGRGDPRTVHAGLPPTSGRKWVLSQWIRDRDQPIV